MIKPRAILIDENPEAIVQTSTGWRYPDGTVKPFYKQQVPSEPAQGRSSGLLAYLAARVFAKQQN